MKQLLLLIFVCFLSSLRAQPNCEAYKYYGDDLKYKACIVAEKRAGHYQFSRAYQEALDEALDIDSTFAFAYKAKSTAYLKSGDFIQWMDLMDKAVLYDPKENLDYRGWCRYQFFRDYQGAIDDIELLDSLVDYDIGYCQNGKYHLHIARALCYKSLGQAKKAIYIIEKHIADSSYSFGLFDYLHLGVLYLEQGKFKEALISFEKQVKANDIAENRYYEALAYKALDQPNNCQSSLDLAHKKYLESRKMMDTYVSMADKIYLEDIERELLGIKN